jgi:hypothetical protein
MDTARVMIHAFSGAVLIGFGVSIALIAGSDLLTLVQHQRLRAHYRAFIARVNDGAVEQRRGEQPHAGRTTDTPSEEEPPGPDVGGERRRVSLEEASICNSL